MTQDSILSLEKNDQALIATVEVAEIDYRTSGQLRSEIVAAASDAPNLVIILDISNVQILPSVALGALVALTRIFKKENQRFILAGPNPEIRDTLAVCRLDKMFEIHETPEEALTHLSAG